MKRRCNTCAMHNKPPVEATFVASDATGLLWFECDEHGPMDNVAEVERVKRTPIGEWFASVGLNLDDVEDIDDSPPPTER